MKPKFDADEINLLSLAKKYSNENKARKLFEAIRWPGGKRLTQEFEAFVLTLMREMPVKKAGEILGETDQKLWRALFAHVAAAWKELSWEKVIWVGADEMNRKKGHNYLTVFMDLQAKRVLLAVEGKDASVWERFAAELGKHNGHPRAITMVAIDMSPAYQKGVRENFWNAQIVFAEGDSALAKAAVAFAVADAPFGMAKTALAGVRPLQTGVLAISSGRWTRRFSRGVKTPWKSSGVALLV